MRVRMRNFMTYTDVETRPGPRLNVLCGPNGSGKSSLVTAIGLCMGSDSTSAGRGMDMHKYVKNGETKGSVEVELFEALDDSRNAVIKLNLTTNGSPPVFFEVNGKRQTKQNVKKLVKQLGIHIDNLCCFLAQERVQKFTQLNSTKLLEETEKAVDLDYYKQHQDLIHLSKSENKLDKELTSVLETLQRRETEFQSLDKKMAEMKGYEENEKKIELLQKLQLWVRHGNAKIKSKELKADQRELEKDLGMREQKLQPVKSELSQNRKQAKRLDERSKKQDSLIRKLVREQTKCTEQLDTLEDTVHGFLGDIKHAKEGDKNREKRCARAQQDVERAEKELREAQDEVPDDIEARFRTLKIQRKKLQRQRSTINREYNNENRVKAKKESRLKTKMKERQNVVSEEDQRWRAAGPEAKAVHKVVEQSKHRLRGQVWGPVFNEIKVRNPLHRKYVEHVCRKVFWYYVVENQADWSLLAQIVKDYQGFKGRDGRPKRLQIPLVSVESIRNLPSREALRRHLTDNGATGFVDELIEDAPPKVMQALRDVCKVHLIAYADREVSADNMQNVLQSSPRDRGVRTLLNVDNQLRVNFSRYGKHQASTRDSKISRPRILRQGQMGQTNPRAQLDQEIARLEKEIRESEQKMNRIKDQDMKLDTPIRNTMDEIKKVGDAKYKVRKAEGKLRQKKSDLKDIEEEEPSETKIRELNAEISQCNQKRLKLAATLVKISERCRAELAAQDAVKLELKQVERRVIELERAFESEDAQLDGLRAQIHQLKEQYQFAKNEEKQLKDVAKREAPRDIWGAKIQEAFQAEENPAGSNALDIGDSPTGWLPRNLQLEEYKALEEQLKIRNDSVSVDRSVIDRHRLIGQEIKDLSQKRDGLEKSLAGNKEILEQKQGQWIRNIENLCQSISSDYSNLFAKIGCKGEVRIKKADNFEEYGLEIFVSFRPGQERLAELLRSGKSGGEKSVSTMLYLLSLQKVTKTPFRVVDEINQGMDENNERATFNAIVNGCARRSDQNGSQYFLVTPKLLPELEMPADADIRMLCVANGPTVVLPRGMYRRKPGRGRKRKAIAVA